MSGRRLSLGAVADVLVVPVLGGLPAPPKTIGCWLLKAPFSSSVFSYVLSCFLLRR